MKKLINKFKVAVWAFKNPRVFETTTFPMLASLLELILKVATEEKHLMTHIAYINPIDGKESQIVSIWAGSGVAAEPTKRIKELLEENSRLKTLLNQQKND
jgi:hypothetical protein